MSKVVQARAEQQRKQKEMMDQFIDGLYELSPEELDQFNPALIIPFGLEHGLSLKNCYVQIARYLTHLLGMKSDLGPTLFVNTHGEKARAVEADGEVAEWLVALSLEPEALPNDIRQRMASNPRIWKTFQQVFRLRRDLGVATEQEKELLQDMGSGQLPQPKGKGGRPKGTGHIQRRDWSETIAVIMRFVYELAKRNGHKITLDLSLGITSEALRQEGFRLSAASVDEAYKKHASVLTR